MGSTFITVNPSEVDRTGALRNAPPQMIWLQFVPGHVTGVKSGGRVVAEPYVGQDKSKRFYHPLIRGIKDTAMQGDQVLLCTFAEHNYYLGPLNTDNKPNSNWDNFFKSPPKATSRHQSRGLNEDFPVHSVQRVQKISKPDLDGSPRITHGDVLLEGRHGNSIRVGSRSADPYIIFSNGRHFINSTESVGDGSLIAMINKGTIRQHFDEYFEDGLEETVPGFLLGSDHQEEPNRTLADLFGESLNSENPSEAIYGYGGRQLFQSSDRIILNAKKEHIFASAKRNINIGAGEHLTLSSNNKILFGATNIYLGKEEGSQGLVLGENLRAVIESLLDILISTVGNLNGAPVPLLENPVVGKASPIGIKLNTLKQKLKQGAQADFVSSKHFLESNEQ